MALASEQEIAVDKKDCQKTLKACVCYFNQIFIFSPNGRPSKTSKNTFLFHQKSSLFSRYLNV